MSSLCQGAHLRSPELLRGTVFTDRTPECPAGARTSWVPARAPVLIRSANDVDDDERSCARIAKHMSRGRLQSIGPRWTPKAAPGR